MASEEVKRKAHITISLDRGKWWGALPEHTMEVLRGNLWAGPYLLEGPYPLEHERAADAEVVLVLHCYAVDMLLLKARIEFLLDLPPSVRNGVRVRQYQGGWRRGRWEE